MPETKKSGFPLHVEDGMYTAHFDSVEERDEFVRLKNLFNDNSYKYRGFDASEGLFATWAYKRIMVADERWDVYINDYEPYFDELNGRMIHPDPFHAPRKTLNDHFVAIYINMRDEDGNPVPEGDGPSGDWDHRFESIHQGADEAIEHVNDMIRYRKSF